VTETIFKVQVANKQLFVYLRACQPNRIYSKTGYKLQPRNVSLLFTSGDSVRRLSKKKPTPPAYTNYHTTSVHHTTIKSATSSHEYAKLQKAQDKSSVLGASTAQRRKTRGFGASVHLGKFRPRRRTVVRKNIALEPEHVAGRCWR